MNGRLDIDGIVTDWLTDQAPPHAPRTVLSTALERVADEGQARPVGLGLGRWANHRSALGAPTAVVVLALLVAGLLIAAVVGRALLEPPPLPGLGGNGLVAYSVWETGVEVRSQDSAMHLLAADGTVDRRIGQGTCPTFANDGRTFSYRAQWSSSEVIVEATDGSSRITILDETGYHYSWRRYAMSPDGTIVAWFEPLIEITLPDENDVGPRNELWVKSVSGGPATRIVPASTDPNESFGAPAWSPDGREIAFENWVVGDDSHRSAISIVNVDGSDLRHLTTRPADGSTTGPVWSPGGGSIAYLGLPDGAALPPELTADPPLDIFVINVDGTGDRNLTDSPAFERLPTWSPDGTRLAYLVAPDPEAIGRLAVMSPNDGSPVTTPLLGPDSDSYTWSPDGQLLLTVLNADIRTIDPGFRTPPTTVSRIVSPDPEKINVGGVECQPSWQRLEP